MDNTYDLPLGLYWKNKRTQVDRIVLPFQSLEIIETINESRATREKEKDSFFKTDPNEVLNELKGWRNKLIWGDNKYVMSALLETFAGKIDLIYIDPPFATGANFSTTVTIGDEDEVEHTKEASAMEELAYRDTWGKGLDSFLQMMYDRLVLMRELLSDKGAIYVHVDWRTNSHIRLILDEIFGASNLVNEIIWSYRTGGVSKTESLPKKHDYILLFKKSNKFKVNNKKERQYLEKPFMGSLIDKSGKYYVDTILRDVFEGLINVVDNNTIKEYNVRPVLNLASERLDYPTQKPEGLISLLIEIASNKGDLVADFFCGSGTTAAVAEKLGRRWIVTDIGRFGIHTTRKRMLEVEGCKPFEILNIGKYERQYWQSFTFGKKTKEQTLAEYTQFILQLYKADALPCSAFIHGKRGNKLVHIGSVDAPVTLGDVQQALQETLRMKQKELVILGWDWEMGLHDVVENEAEKAGVKLSLLNIPREVMDRRAVETGDVQFFELAYLETELKKTKYGFAIELKDFVIPNLDLIPNEVKKLIKKWSDYIDYWSVDWDYEDDTFHNMWQSYRTKKERNLKLTTDYHEYSQKGVYKAMVKVIDIFGNDTTHILEVTNE